MTTRQTLDHETLIALIHRLESLGVLDETDREALAGKGRETHGNIKMTREEFERGRGPPDFAPNRGNK